MSSFRSIAILLVSVVVLFLIGGLARAQSIAINSVSAQKFCAGDPVSVTFTATGAWGHKNAFTLQLSNPAGSFQSADFTTLASLIDTESGTFTIASSIPFDASFSNRYRFRVMAANPYAVSTDNSSPIIIGEAPFRTRSVVFQRFAEPWLINIPLRIFGTDNKENSRDTIHWDFGANSSPSSLITNWDLVGPSTTYSAGGHKTVIGRHVAPGGCEVTEIIDFKVLDCTIPLIPHDAFVVSDDADLGADSLGLKRVFWVNPGVKVKGGSGDTIYAESGATVDGGSSNIVYLKPGAMGTNVSGLVIYADGASADSYYKLGCPNLAFDYSNAPSNPVMHISSSVEADAQYSTIEITPNPATDKIWIHNTPRASKVAVIDLLGRTQIELSPQSPDLGLDLSRLSPGTYYIRFASTKSILTKKIIKH